MEKPQHSLRPRNIPPPDVWRSHREITWDGGDHLGLKIVHSHPIEVELWSNLDAAWGIYASTHEQTQLAINVLDRATQHLQPRTCEEWERPLPCNPWAYRLAWMYAEAYLAFAEYWRVELSLEEARRWATTAIMFAEEGGVDLLFVTPAERFRYRREPDRGFNPPLESLM